MSPEKRSAMPGMVSQSANAKPIATGPATAFRISTHKECLALFSGETTLRTDRAWPVTANAWLKLHKANLGAHTAPGANLAWWLSSDYLEHNDSKQQTASTFAFVPPALRCFEGHFPDQPLLPGVVQLDWSIGLAAQLWPTEKPADAFRGTARLKFKAPIKPADVINVELTPSDNSILFKISSHREVLTSGQLNYID